MGSSREKKQGNGWLWGEKNRVQAAIGRKKAGAGAVIKRKKQGWGQL